MFLRDFWFEADNSLFPLNLKQNGYILFTHFCDSKSWSKTNAARGKQQHQTSESNFMLMRIQKHQKL